MSQASGGRRGRYGVDAPYALLGLTVGAVAFLAWTVFLFAAGFWFAWLILLSTIYTTGAAASYAYTTLRGKFRVWAGELDRLHLTGSERVLDLGCGRGAVLILVARRLVGGLATGVDLWRTKDQSGNAEQVTRANAVTEGVADRIELDTADMRELPFPEASFDLVVSSLAIHNIPAVADRRRAVIEAYRVVAPGGRVRIADYRNAPDYAEILRAAGATGVVVRNLGWRFWYGGPFFATHMVTADKPELGIV
jgi:arsenite methyltransferase